MLFRMTLAGLVALSAPAAAEDKPHRTIDVERTTTAPMDEVTTCLARWGAPFGRPAPLPMDGGVALDLYQGTLFVKGEPVMTVQIRDGGDVRRVTMLYRHPYSAKAVKSLLKNAAKKCALGDEVPLPAASAPPSPRT